MRAEEVSGLSYEDGLPIVKSLLKDRMRWIWTEDIDRVYEKALSELQDIFL